VTAAALVLPDGLTVDMLAAAALVEAGPVDPELAPCAACGDPPIAHDNQHTYHPDPIWRLALQAQAAADRTVMDDIVAQLNTEHIPSGKTGPSPSDAGACRRALWYRDRPPADYTPRQIDERRAAIGTLIHAAGAHARSMRYPWRRYEMTVAIPGLDRGGRIDEYDPVFGEVVDWKTAGQAKWEIVGDDGPTPDMWAQPRIYAYALDMAGYPVRRIRIITINRDIGAEESFAEDHDPAKGLAALDALTEAATMIEAGVVPPRDGYGTRDWRCKWCPAMEHCWNVDRAAELGRSPESLTVLGERPDDPSIAWAGREAITLAGERLALEKREERAKGLLQGIRPGVYGADGDQPVEVFLDWHTSYGYKAAYERLAGLYELPDEVRPPLAEVDEVPKKTTRKTAAKRVRAAKRAAARKPRGKALPAADAAGAQLAAQVAEETMQ
jgi:hypothetical protein